MSKHVLVTGGAGFIGSFIVDELLRRGHRVRILDNLEPQVHKVFGGVPPYLNKKAELLVGDVRDRNTIKDALNDVDIVFHEAGMVGVGQSQYQIQRYLDANVMGTAQLLDVLANEKHAVKKILVAGSISEYGEGSCACPECGIVNPPLRPEEQLKRKDWELHCPECNSTLAPVGTKEDKLLDVNSIYAISKQAQEQMVLNIGKTYGIPAVSLRYWNTYGPRQSLGNPYTGVCAIFMSRLKNNQPPVIFEDGKQRRDFVSVHDIVQANMLAMESEAANGQIFNVGSGQNYSILEIAQTLAKMYGRAISPQVTGDFRKGDVRHCFADISKIRQKLGFKPGVTLEAGLNELKEWVDGAPAIDTFAQATSEMKLRNIVV
ncbi:SDR family NAD(P)-dependent oxidoreductase [Candidatus Woesearchaeota archaeon]|nr:SDR family NAD(P)-dependent oxidoreductase [Candidatus Woesearchaeota archaeon]